MFDFDNTGTECLKLIDDEPSSISPIQPKLWIGHPLRKTGFKRTKNNWLPQEWNWTASRLTQEENTTTGFVPTSIKLYSMKPKYIAPQINKFLLNPVSKNGYVFIPVDIGSDKVAHYNPSFPVLFQEEENQRPTYEQLIAKPPVCQKLHFFELQNTGKYSPQVRQQKIYKYKNKITKWRNGANNNKDLYSKRRKLAKLKVRVRGRFIKQWDAAPTSSCPQMPIDH